MKFTIFFRRINITIIFLSLFFNYKTFSLSIEEAMSEAYKNSPEIMALRSKLKASNQEISRVLSEKRPQISLDSRMGYDRTDTISTSSIEKTQYNSPRSLTLDITQNIYDSGKTNYNLKKNEAEILSYRSDLFSQEQNIILKTAKTYLNLFEAIEINKLAKNNYSVLAEHLEATKNRFDVGEVTITDLSQARARLLKAQANEIKTRGDIEIEKSNFFSLVGKDAPNFLKFPEKKYILPDSLKEVIQIAVKNNPRIISYGLIKKASFSDISLSITELLPKLDLSLSAQKAWDPNTFFNEYQNFKVDLSLKVPLYNGGANYANVRQKRYSAIEKSKLLDNEIKKLIKEIEIVWFSLQTYKTQIKAIKASIVASNTALAGVKEEATVGTRTTLDVLDAEQETLQEEIELIIVKNNILSSTYELLKKMGSLSPKNLELDTQTLSYEKDYEAVKKIWLGFEG